MKYTPLDIENDAAVDVALVAIHDANDSPDGINALLLGPETISLSANNNSPSANVLIWLSSTPEDMYEIYNVKLPFSLFSDMRTCLIIAVTPVVAPIIFLSINCSI